MKKIALGLVALLALEAAVAERIAVLSPDVADIVVALGASDQVVGKDSNSKHHKSLAKAKDIGVYRSLSPEPIMAAKPTVAMGSWMVQPSSLYQQLNQVGVKAINVSPKETGADYIQGIIRIGQITGKNQEAKALASKWQTQMAALPKTAKRYLLSYDGRLVSGSNTVGDYLIRQAGGVNAAANIEGTKPMSREAWIMAKPDVIIIASHNVGVLGGLERYKAQPEIAGSNAAKNNKVVMMDAKDFLRLGLDTPSVVKKMNALAK